MLSGEVVLFEFYTHTAHENIEPQHPRLQTAPRPRCLDHCTVYILG